MVENRYTVHRRDRVEMIIGACIMGFPAAATGEIWDLGEQLPHGHILLFAVASFVILAFTIYVLHGHDAPHADRHEFVIRVLSTYGLTLLVCSLMLFGLGQFDVLGDPMTGIKRTVIVAFPASFAATAVDSFAPTGNGDSRMSPFPRHNVTNLEEFPGN